MNVFRLFVRNLAAGPVTLRLPRQVHHPAGFKGPVRIDEKKCICCGMCDYVCVSKAVVVTPSGDGCEWSYHPGHCTYCGKCVQVCPAVALSMAAESAHAYTRPDELDDIHYIPYPPCAECGTPTQPVDEVVLIKAFKEINDEVRVWLKLCPRCRRKKHMKDIFSALEKAGPAKGTAREKE